MEEPPRLENRERWSTSHLSEGRDFRRGRHGYRPAQALNSFIRPVHAKFFIILSIKGNEPFAVYAGYTGTRNVLSLNLPDDSPIAGIECVDDGLNMGLGISGVFFIIRSGTAERGHTNAHPRASTSQL